VRCLLYGGAEGVPGAEQQIAAQLARMAARGAGANGPAEVRSPMAQSSQNQA
jgi:hypothetical protein